MKITLNFDRITFIDIQFVENIFFHEIIYIEQSLKLRLYDIYCRMQNYLSDNSSYSMGGFLEIHNVLSIYIDNTSISESFDYTEYGRIHIMDSSDILNNLQEIFLFPENLMNVDNNLI